LADWQLKAMREAKLATDWLSPNVEYEDAARSFLYAIMEDERFAFEAAALARRIGPAGAVNGLAQTLLKLTVPGVPDFYQGTEYWDQSLVDPDNRRPVDFERRIHSLEVDEDPTTLAEHWRDGRVKQAVIRRALALRSKLPDLFARGTYQPLVVAGKRSEHVVAFARSHEDNSCIVVVPRLSFALLQSTSRRDNGHGEQPDGIVFPKSVWGDTVLRLPDDLAAKAMHDRTRDGRLYQPAREISLEALLGGFPVALLATA